MELRAWQLAAAAGVILLISALIQLLASASLLEINFPASLIDLYEAGPNVAAEVTADRAAALLVMLVSYPAALAAGLTAAAGKREMLAAAGLFGLAWWAAAAYIIASLNLA